MDPVIAMEAGAVAAAQHSTTPQAAQHQCEISSIYRSVRSSLPLRTADTSSLELSGSITGGECKEHE
jgi:hypothetical protein